MSSPARGIGSVELVPGVHRIDAEVGGRPLYLYLFLGERRMLLDSGCASTVSEFIEPALAGLDMGPGDLDLLVITHSDLDHQGGAGALRRANPSLWVSCGVEDIPLVSDPETLVARRYQAYLDEHGIGPDSDGLAWMREESGEPVSIDIGWRGGEVLSLGSDWDLRLLHVPGHSPGHLAVFDERSEALFSGDCLQGSVYLGLDGTRKLCPTYTDVDDYLSTASLVESLSPRQLHSCHWPAAVDREQVAAFIAETRGYACHLDSLVRDTLGSRPLTLASLIEQVNQALEPPWPGDLAQELVYSVHGHAERLVARGTAIREDDGAGRITYLIAEVKGNP